jgi:hypothetical protein
MGKYQLPDRLQIVLKITARKIGLILAAFHGATAVSGRGPPHYRGFAITLRQTTLRRTPLDELSARQTDLYLTAHNTHKRQTSMPPVGFEPGLPASERPNTPHIIPGGSWIGFQ